MNSNSPTPSPPPPTTEPKVVDLDSIQAVQPAQPIVAVAAVDSATPAIPTTPTEPAVANGGGTVIDEDEDDELQIVEAHITNQPPRIVDDDVIEIVEEAFVLARPPVPRPTRPKRRNDSEIEVVAVNPVKPKENASNTTTLEPVKDTKCAACLLDLPADAEAVLLSRCRHSLCVECAIRCVADNNQVGESKAKDANGFNAAHLSKNPMCVVPRCRAPLSQADALEALAPPSADKHFESALKSFHAWVQSETGVAQPSHYGPAYIQLPEFTPEMAKAALKQPVSADELVGDDFEGAYGILWEWDEEYIGDDNVKGGCWTCLACGDYVSVGANRTNANNKMEDEELMEIDGGIPDHPPYPHCDKARAYALMESINCLSKVGEETGKPKAKPKARKTRSSSKRHRSAKSVTSSKRQRTNTVFAKGTGYAGKIGAEWKGASAKMLESTKKVDKAMAFWLAMIRCYIVRTKESTCESWPCYMRVLLRECKITELLSKILINESIMDVGQRVGVYVAALRVVAGLNESPSLRLLVAEPSENGRSLADLVQSFSKQAALLSNGAGQTVLDEETKLLIKQIRKSIRGILRYNLLRSNKRTNGFELRVSMNPNDYHALADVDKLNKEMQDIATAKETNEIDIDAVDEIQAENKDEEEGHGVSEERKKKYMEVMKDLQFATVPSLAQASSFRKEAPNRSSSEVGRGKGMRRVISEVSALYSSLPLNWSSTIALRVDEDRYDFLRACIFGPEGTPYDCGVFIFDIFLPPEYPQEPPKFRFLTTGGGRARFNPNLYSNGKVCLSLLGTWDGPTWTPASTLLQVLVSIQSLILVQQPFFNEPGYEKMYGTPSGNERSKIYNINQHHNTINHAMLDQIRGPFAEFKVVIEAHFRLKRPTVEKVLQGWLKESNEVREKLLAKKTSKPASASANGAGSSSYGKSKAKTVGTNLHSIASSFPMSLGAGITAGAHAGSMAAFAENIGSFLAGLPPGTVGGPSSPNGASNMTPGFQAMQMVQALGLPGMIGMGMEKNINHSMDMKPSVDKMKIELDKLDGIVKANGNSNANASKIDNDKIEIDIADEDEDEHEKEEMAVVVEVD